MPRRSTPAHGPLYQVWAGAVPNHTRPTNGILAPRPKPCQSSDLTAFASAFQVDSGIRLRRPSKPWLSWLARSFVTASVVGSNPIGGTDVVRPGSDRSIFLCRLRHSPTSTRKIGDRRRPAPHPSHRCDSIPRRSWTKHRSPTLRQTALGQIASPAR